MMKGVMGQQNSYYVHNINWYIIDHAYESPIKYCMYMSKGTVAANKKLTFRFVARSFRSACITVHAYGYTFTRSF